MSKIDGRATEARNLATVDIDSLPTIDVVRLIHQQDETVPGAVAGCLPMIAAAVDAAAARFSAGGSLHYFGAGTSGRLCYLDAVELPPTFGIDPRRVIAHLAGDAFDGAREEAEDDEALGLADARDLTGRDVVVALTASGTTPYVRGVLATAREAGAFRVLITASPSSPLSPLADLTVSADTGAEVIAGSTRMKAGTAQKLILNNFSTALMIRLGRTWSNLMVAAPATNEKLRARAIHTLGVASGRPENEVQRALALADGESAVALIALVAASEIGTARTALAHANGRIHDAITHVTHINPRQDEEGGDRET